MPKSRIRYAVAGLGYITQVAMLPAFAGASRNSQLAALLSGDRTKLRALGRRYGVAQLGGYDDLRRLVAEDLVDALYVGLPNTMHRDLVVAAGRLGVPVLCEKPLATTLADCRAMIAATRRLPGALMTAYRLHFEPGYLAALDAIHSGRIGKPRFFASQFSMQVRPGNIRTRAELGGGPLFDLGIYCVNAARHVFRAEPVEVMAQLTRGADRRFRDVEEMAQVLLRFPGGRFASFTCSLGASDASNFQVWGVAGSVRLEQAYEMAGAKTLIVEHMSRGALKRNESRFAKVDQFAPLLLAFSAAIQDSREAAPSGKEGAADVRVLEAIFESGRRRASVRLPPLPFSGRRLSRADASTIEAHAKPVLVRARAPSR